MYFPWRAQWDALLIAYDIYGYVDGTLLCPTPFLNISTAGSSVSQPNLAHTFWICQDKFIPNALLASIN